VGPAPDAPDLGTGAAWIGSLMTVLILADDVDRGADAMTAELRRRAVPVARVNLGWFPRRLTMRAELEDGRWVGSLRTADMSVSLEDIRAIWMRSPTTFQLPEGLTPPEHQHAHTEAKLGLGGVLMSLPVRWVNRPDRAATASYGPFQLAAAHAAGLSPLPTLITNRPDAVRSFAVRHGEVSTSLLGAPVLAEAGTHQVAYTERYEAADLEDLVGIEHTAHQFCRWPTKLCEARVVAVGRTLMTTLVHAGNTRAWVDWRNDYDAIVYEKIEVDPGVGYAVCSLLDTLGLSYAILDFAIGPDHRWRFLAAHPHAGFELLEQSANLPVTATLADLLHSGPR
jgi:hypothetical protein